MTELINDLQALLLPWIHALLDHIGFDPGRGSLLDRVLLLVASKTLAVCLVLWGQRLVIAIVRRAFAFYHRRHIDDEATAPGGSAMQMAAIFVRTLTVLAVAGILLDLTVNRLVTIVSTSAALLVLLFRDTVLGFVAGTLLLRNRMIRLGDWLTVTNPQAQGVIEEINIMTVRLRDHDNSFYYVPTYTLLTRTFQNWSGMKERSVRMVTLAVWLDVSSVTEQNVAELKAWLYEYLPSRPEVSPHPFLLVRHPMTDGRGLGVEALVFLRSTVWLETETQRAALLEAVIQKLPHLGLRQYQFGGGR